MGGSLGSSHHAYNNFENVNNDLAASLCASVVCIQGKDYVQAAQQKTRAIKFLERIFSEKDEDGSNKIDMIVTPTVGVDTGKRHASEVSGEEASIRTNYLCNALNFMFLGNLTGIPGINIPIGTYVNSDGKELPVGLQLQAPWFREDMLYDLALKLENEIGLVKSPSACYYEF